MKIFPYFDRKSIIKFVEMAGNVALSVNAMP